MVRGRQPALEVNLRQYCFHGHACKANRDEATDNGGDDVHDPSKCAALPRPGFVNSHGQHDDENDQQIGHRATDARLGAEKIDQKHSHYGEQCDYRQRIHSFTDETTRVSQPRGMRPTRIFGWQFGSSTRLARHPYEKSSATNPENHY